MIRAHHTVYSLQVLTGPIKLITGHGHTEYVNMNHFWCLVFSSASRSWKKW